MKDENITYANKEIKKLCTDEKYQSKKLSKNIVNKLRKRYQELRIAETVMDLKDGPGKWHALHENLAGHFAATLSGNERIIVRGTDEAGNNKQWHECRAVKVVAIGRDYH